MKAVRFFDPQQAKTMTLADNFTESLPGYEKKHARDEIAPYKLAANELAPDITPLDFWFANKEHFPYLFELALHYLCIPGNSADAERSVSMYTQVNAPQRQGLSDDNQENSVMFAFNLKQNS